MSSTAQRSKTSAGFQLGTVDVELTDADDKVRQSLTLRVSNSKPIYGEWPTRGSGILDGNVGYLRLSRMDEAAVNQIQTWMPKFRDTIGLVVDVRGNGGGVRAPLQWMHSYIAAPEDPPHVFTAAAYRRNEAHSTDHLSARFMYRANASEWSAAERVAVATFATTFKPMWSPPKGQFSELHYVALSRIDAPDFYHYNKPIVVLMDAKCFSATEIFLAGVKGLDNVLLVGTPSGGGSAFAQEFSLGPTPFRLRIGSMVSLNAGPRCHRMQQGMSRVVNKWALSC